MSNQDSSPARVQPIFNALLDGWPDGEPWLGELWELASLTRPGVALPPPADPGYLLPAETPADRTERVGKVFDRTVPPPLAFLRWLLDHPEQMHVSDRVAFGAKSDDAIAWRRKLFSGDSALVLEAQQAGIERLSQRLAQRARQKWWAFEGFTRVDCCLISDRAVLLVEGQADVVATSTRWFQPRRQLWRNVEAARELASGKEFGVMLAVESDPDGQAALVQAQDSLAASYPHLSSEEQNELGRHFLGFVTWADVVTRFGLPPNCMVTETRG